MAEVIVFGSGPSGLMAAHAAEAAGHEVIKIWDKRAQPPDGKTAGVFYLHQPCGLDVKSQEIRVSTEGDRHRYAERVYGDPNAPCNWPDFPYAATAWDGMAAVQILFDRYCHLVERAEVTLEAVQIMAATERQRFFISTIPLNILLKQYDLPYSMSQIFSNQTDSVFYQGMPHMTYMGIEGVDATRRSWIHGRYAIEAPMDVDWSTQDPDWAYHVTKKVQPSTAAMEAIDAYEYRHPNLLLTGRYGRWDKTMLTHRVYEHVLGRLG